MKLWLIIGLIAAIVLYNFRNSNSLPSVMEAGQEPVTAASTEVGQTLSKTIQSGDEEPTIPIAYRFSNRSTDPEVPSLTFDKATTTVFGDVPESQADRYIALLAMLDRASDSARVKLTLIRVRYLKEHAFSVRQALNEFVDTFATPGIFFYATDVQLAASITKIVNDSLLPWGTKGTIDVALDTVVHLVEGEPYEFSQTGEQVQEVVTTTEVATTQEEDRRQFGLFLNISVSVMEGRAVLQYQVRNSTPSGPQTVDETNVKGTVELMNKVVVVTDFGKDEMTDVRETLFGIPFGQDKSQFVEQVIVSFRPLERTLNGKITRIP